jgi:hypothetical protein
MRTRRLLSPVIAIGLLLGSVCLLVGSVLLFGCDAVANRKTNVDSSKLTKVPVEEQIKRIDDNPNMPPAAKESAKAAIRAHSGGQNVGR